MGSVWTVLTWSRQGAPECEDENDEDPQQHGWFHQKVTISHRRVDTKVQSLQPPPSKHPPLASGSSHGEPRVTYWSTPSGSETESPVFHNCLDQILKIFSFQASPGPDRDIKQSFKMLQLAGSEISLMHSTRFHRSNVRAERATKTEWREREDAWMP